MTHHQTPPSVPTDEMVKRFRSQPGPHKKAIGYYLDAETVENALRAALAAMPGGVDVRPDGEITDEMVDEAIAAMSGKEWWRSVSPTTAGTWRVDMRRALTAALAVQPSGWRPIDSAPKDGTVIWGRWVDQTPWKVVYDRGWFYAEGEQSECPSPDEWRPVDPAPPAAQEG